MQSREMTIRMVWKEWSRGWPWLALGLALPQICFVMAACIKGDTAYASLAAMYPLLAGYGVIAAVAIRASTLAEEHRRGTYSAIHFPQDPAIRRALPFLVHLLGVLLIAATLTAWFAADSGLTTIVAILLFFTTLFLLSYLVAWAFSPWAGIMAGIGWLLCHMPILHPFVGDPAAASASQAMHDTLRLLALSLPVFVAWLAMALIPRRLQTAQRCATGGAMLVLALAIPLTPFLTSTGFPLNRTAGSAHAGRSMPPDDYRVFMSSDRTVVISADGSLAIGLAPVRMVAGKITLRFGDYRHGRMVNRTFRGLAVPLGFADAQTAILAVQHSGARMVAIQRWTLDNDLLTTVATLPVGREALLNLLQYNIPSQDWETISPDGRHAMLMLPSRLGTRWARDLWLIDLETGSTRVALPGRDSWNLGVTWTTEAALVRAGGHVWQIDRTSGTVTPWEKRMLVEARP